MTHSLASTILWSDIGLPSSRFRNVTGGLYKRFLDKASSLTVSTPYIKTHI